MPPRHPINPYAPKFDPDAWINQQSTPLSPNPGHPLTGFDCYQYAIAGSEPGGKNNVYDEVVAGPGETRGLSLEAGITPQTMDRLLSSDGLRWAGRERDKLPPNQPGHYTVAVYLSQAADGRYDHHFIRQNREGGWDDKDTIDFREKPKLVLPPAADGGYQIPPEDSEGRRFFGYVQVPWGGIDAGPEVDIRRRLLESPQGEECKAIKGWTDRINPNNQHNPDIVGIERAIDKYGRTGLAEIFRGCVDARIAEFDPGGLGEIGKPNGSRPAREAGVNLPLH